MKLETRNWKLETDKNGFTIIELIVTLLMLFAVVQVFVAITNDVNTLALVRDNLIAANLVQEGVEVVPPQERRPGGVI